MRQCDWKPDRRQDNRLRCRNCARLIGKIPIQANCSGDPPRWWRLARLFLRWDHGELGLGDHVFLVLLGYGVTKKRFLAFGKWAGFFSPETRDCGCDLRQARWNSRYPAP